MTGESLFTFYPGVNLDRNHWESPLELDFSRVFTHDNQNMFGGSRYACIGSKIALQFFSLCMPYILQNLTPQARVLESEVEVDAGWIAERVITRMPIRVP